MYQIISRSCYAPKSGNGRYRRPVRILVVSKFKSCYRHNDPAIVREWKNVDSRYDGPRSAHGQALSSKSWCGGGGSQAGPSPSASTFESRKRPD